MGSLRAVAGEAAGALCQPAAALGGRQLGPRQDEPQQGARQRDSGSQQ